MVRRHKAARWEAFIAPYRAIADKDSDYFKEYNAWYVVSRHRYARILRVTLERGERAHRRGRNQRGSLVWNPAHQRRRAEYGRRKR
jgi:hypothetical protein